MVLNSWYVLLSSNCILQGGRRSVASAVEASTTAVVVVAELAARREGGFTAESVSRDTGCGAGFRMGRPAFSLTLYSHAMVAAAVGC